MKDIEIQFNQAQTSTFYGTIVTKVSNDFDVNDEKSIKDLLLNWEGDYAVAEFSNASDMSLEEYNGQFYKTKLEELQYLCKKHYLDIPTELVDYVFNEENFLVEDGRIQIDDVFIEED